MVFWWNRALPHISQLGPMGACLGPITSGAPMFAVAPPSISFKNARFCKYLHPAAFESPVCIGYLVDSELRLQIHCAMPSKQIYLGVIGMFIYTSSPSMDSSSILASLRSAINIKNRRRRRGNCIPSTARQTPQSSLARPPGTLFANPSVPRASILPRHPSRQ